MAFDPYQPRGVNRRGMPRATGQQTGESIFLDMPEEQEEPLYPAQPQAQPRGQQRIPPHIQALMMAPPEGDSMSERWKSAKSNIAAIPPGDEFAVGKNRQFGQPRGVPSTQPEPVTEQPSLTMDPGAAAQSKWNPGGSYTYRPIDQLGGSAFAGFNDERALSGGDAKSTKDLFRRVVGGMGIDLREVIGTGPDAMQRAEQLSRDRIAPALMAEGADVLDVKNDKILIRTYENPDGEWVDVYRNAGADNVDFWWGAQGTGADPAASGAYARFQQPRSNTMPVTDPNFIKALMDPESENTQISIDQLLAALQQQEGADSFLQQMI